MSANPLASIVKTGATELLMQLLSQIPGWQGPSRTQFDHEVRSLISRLEDAEEQITVVLLAESVLKLETGGIA